MKKYSLLLKKGVLIGCDEFPKLTSGNKHCPSFEMLYKTDHTRTSLPFGFVPDSYLDHPEEKTTFTQQEIDALPHGLVKLLNVLEIEEEELYYIKMPYGSDNYLNEYPNKTDVGFFSEDDVCNFKTKFTLPYIEDTYPLLKQFAVKVEEEIDNE